MGKILSFNIKPGGKYSNHSAVKDSSALSRIYFLLLFFPFYENARYVFRLILGLSVQLAYSKRFTGTNDLHIRDAVLMQVTTQG